VSAEFRDLFGDLIPPKRGRGRPSHVPTIENLNKIKAWRKHRIPKAKIAKALGITKPTLLAHYFRDRGKKIRRRL
jgi:hypothetical protein